jgi:predicted esterase
VVELIINEGEKLKEDLSKIYLGGFSQGGALALATYLMFQGGPLGGLTCVSGALLTPI